LKISGQSIIGSHSALNAGQPFRATNPRTGENLPPDFFSAGPEEVNRAASLAQQAFAIYGQVSGREKGKFLRTIAARIEGAVDELVERAEQETALPKPRLQSETARTSGQLRLFANVVREGSWLEARIDPAATQRAAAKRLIYQDAIERATKSDDMQEFPPYRRVGHLVRGRYSRIHGHGAQDFFAAFRYGRFQHRRADRPRRD